MKSSDKKAMTVSKNVALGKRIKACRKKQGISQAELAELMGVCSNSISQWETGRTAPQHTNIKKLAELFVVYETWLATGLGARNKSDEDAAIIRKTNAFKEAEEAKAAAEAKKAEADAIKTAEEKRRHAVTKSLRSVNRLITAVIELHRSEEVAKTYETLTSIRTGKERELLGGSADEGDTWTAESQAKIDMINEAIKEIPGMSLSRGDKDALYLELQEARFALETISIHRA